MWAASGMSHHNFADSLSQHFYRSVVGGEVVLGRSVRQALAAAGRERNTPYLPAIYNLLGDPALIVGGVASASDPYNSQAVLFEKWRNANFTRGEQLDAETGGDNADPDGDGVGNFVEYALGQNPHSGEAVVLGLRKLNANESVRFSFPRRRGIRDVEFHVDLSGDLKSWVGGSAQIQSIEIDASGSGDTEMVNMTIDNPYPNKDRLFLRFGVSPLAAEP